MTAAQKRTDQAIRKLSADVAELQVMANDMMASITRMSASVDKLTAAQRRTDGDFSAGWTAATTANGDPPAPPDV